MNLTLLANAAAVLAIVAGILSVIALLTRGDVIPNVICLLLSIAVLLVSLGAPR